MEQMPAPRLTFTMELRVQVGPAVEIATTPRGKRRIVPILGGTFEGPELSGTVLKGGADWQIVRPDGVSELDTRYTLQTDGGELIYIQNSGIRYAAPEIVGKVALDEYVEPALVYFRTFPVFETDATDLRWMTRSIFIGDGDRLPDLVVVRVWKVE